MIHRAEHDGDFSQIDNALLRDTTLSDGARSLLFFMLSMSDEWTFSVKALANQFGVDTTTIQTRLAELKRRGYLQTQRLRGEGGRFSSCTWDIYEEPPQVELSTRGENHARKIPRVENTTCGINHARKNPSHKNINIKEHQDIKNIKGEEERSARGEFQNVFLSSSEFDDLVRDFGAEKVKKYIDDLGDYLKTHPKKKYASHKRTIANWIERDEKKVAFHCQPKEAEPIDWDEVTRLAYQIHEEGGTA